MHKSGSDSYVVCLYSSVGVVGRRTVIRDDGKDLRLCETDRAVAEPVVFFRSTDILLLGGYGLFVRCPERYYLETWR